MIVAGVFILGLAILVKGADMLVDGASAIAVRLGITPIVIGLTVVAFGTSLPELIVNIFAALDGSTDIAIGNVLGSNIANILLILGIAALVRPLTVQHGTVWKEIPFSLLAVLVIGVMANDRLIDGLPFNALTASDGLVLLLFFLVFMYYTYTISKNPDIKAEELTGLVPLGWAIPLVLLGLCFLVLGGKAVVDAAVILAGLFGLSEAVIGLTVVAVGTSLPELVTSAIAAYKGNPEIAVGNVIGSNIFNIFWILGVSSVVRSLPFSEALTRDVGMVILVTGMLFAFMFIGKRNELERWQGGSFVLIYAAYLILLVSGAA